MSAVSLKNNRGIVSVSPGVCTIPAIKTIEKLLKTELVDELNMKVPGSGATESDISEEEQLLCRPFSSAHRELLERLNGLDVGWLCFCRCGGGPDDVVYARRISEQTEKVKASALGIDAPIAIACGSGGFVYVEAKSGEIFEIDFDPLGQKKIASNLDDLVDRLVFGKDAARFGGKEWLQDLRVAGMHGEAAQKEELSKPVDRKVAYVDNEGWTRCPKCNFKFHIKSESAFRRNKHQRCGQVLELAAAATASAEGS